MGARESSLALRIGLQPHREHCWISEPGHPRHAGPDSTTRKPPTRLIVWVWVEGGLGVGGCVDIAYTSGDSGWRS